MKEAKAYFDFGNVFAIAYEYVHPGIVDSHSQEACMIQCFYSLAPSGSWSY